VFGSDAIPYTINDLDVTDPNSLQQIKNDSPDIIINTAAFHKTDACEDDPKLTFDVNALGAYNVGMIARGINAINVFISTDYVFNGKSTRPYLEDDAVNPINVYGVTKVAGEMFTRYLTPNHYVLRMASLFGLAGMKDGGGNFIETMIKKAKAGEQIKVINDIIMSPTYTHHVATAFHDMVEKKVPFGTYHVVNSGSSSWFEFTVEIFKLLRTNTSVEPVSTRN
jgi:dTDP-4-dehydrorhamnose reductase